MLKWLDKYLILEDDDIPLLEAGAAIHQFKHGENPDSASGKAYKEYLYSKAIKAMAHHLMGSKAALALNNTDVANQHGQRYEAAAKAGGLDVGQIPKEVMEEIKNGDYSKLVKFKNHETDDLFPQDKEGSPPEAKDKTSSVNKDSVQKLIESLKTFKEFLI